LFPEYLEDWIGEDNPVRAIDLFVEELGLANLGFCGVTFVSSRGTVEAPTSTAISIEFSRAGGSSVRLDAMLR
jgi:hypothetical protein